MEGWVLEYASHEKLKHKEDLTGTVIVSPLSAELLCVKLSQLLPFRCFLLYGVGSLYNIIRDDVVGKKRRRTSDTDMDNISVLTARAFLLPHR